MKKMMLNNPNSMDFSNSLFSVLFSNPLCVNELTSYFIFAKFLFFGIRKVSMVEHEEQDSYACKIILMQPWSQDLLAVFVGACTRWGT